MTIQMIIDGGADVPQELIDKYKLQIVPLNHDFGHTQYKTGELDLPPFYKNLKQSDELPRSSSPSPYDFYQTYKRVDPSRPLLVLSLTKGLSSTYDSAVIGQEMLLEEEPGRKITVLNTNTASSGVALLVEEAGSKIDDGYDLDRLASHMKERIAKTTTLFVLQTLENVIKGGRLDKVRGAIAKTLNIKLLMKASDEKGDIEVIEKVRGNKKALRRFVQQIGDYAHNFEDRIISLSHCNNEELGRKVLQDIKAKYNFKDSLFMETGPLISTYAGEGGLVIAFFRD